MALIYQNKSTAAPAFEQTSTHRLNLVECFPNMKHKNAFTRVTYHKPRLFDEDLGVDEALARCCGLEACSSTKERLKLITVSIIGFTIFFLVSFVPI